MDRKTVLLKATHDLLKQARESGYVKNAMEIIVHYDEADCDGECLMEDIAVELEQDDTEDRALRIDLYKALLQGMVIKGCIDYENPMPDLWRCWRTAKVAVEVTEQV